MKKIKENKLYRNSLPRPTKLEYIALKNDIKKHGIRKKVTVNQKGVLVDGYTRYQIAKELGIKRIPKIVKKFKNKDDELEFVITSNIQRRHLTAFQKVKSFKGIYDKMLENQKVGRTILSARKSFEQLIAVPQTQITKCLKVIRDGDTKTVNEVYNKKLSVDKAFRRITGRVDPKHYSRTIFCVMCQGKGHFPSTEYEERFNLVKEKFGIFQHEQLEKVVQTIKSKGGGSPI